MSIKHVSHSMSNKQKYNKEVTITIFTKWPPRKSGHEILYSNVTGIFEKSLFLISEMKKLIFDPLLYPAILDFLSKFQRNRVYEKRHFTKPPINSAKNDNWNYTIEIM
jgi:hypothetical protein